MVWSNENLQPLIQLRFSHFMIWLNFEDRNLLGLNLELLQFLDTEMQKVGTKKNARAVYIRSDISNLQSGYIIVHAP